MLFAARQLGEADITRNQSDDQAVMLKIQLESHSSHLSEKRGISILNQTVARFNLNQSLQDFGLKIFSILLQAEIMAHQKHRIMVDGHHHHQPVLHEAQDIIIDILGACYGLQFLKIKPKIIQLKPVSTGGGVINFSHGRFRVPAPATEIIIQKHILKTQSGPVEQELLTPTGAAILSALSPVYQEIPLENLTIQAEGRSRGTKKLKIPPLKLYLGQEVKR